MTYELCTVTVKKSLERVPSVSLARIDYGSKTATTTFEARGICTVALVKATTGYPPCIRK